MNPWPVAHTFLKGDRFKIYEALPVEGQGNPGRSSLLVKELIVATAEGAYLKLKCSLKRRTKNGSLSSARSHGRRRTG